jgi:fumarylpyruvate hydrolase
MSEARAYRTPAGPLVFSAPPVTCIPVANTGEFFPVRRVYCVGRNYAAHVREMGGNEREPPFFFQKPTDAIVTSEGVIEYPPATASFQYEVELVVAIGAAGAGIRTEHVHSHVFGFAVGIDLTRRDLQLQARDAGRPWESGKSFDRSAPISAIIRTGPVPLPSHSRISLQVNGVVKQQGVLGDMIWTCDEVVSRLSSLYSLAPGDLIFTGTPAGVGDLNPGDCVEGVVEGVGKVRFFVAPQQATDERSG